MPKLSICIPAVNEEKYLPALLQSIEEQTFRDYEVIVAVDPRTKDRTEELAREMGAAVTVGGPSPAIGRNRAAAPATGEVILFLDSDVVLPDPRFLEATVAELDERGLDFATCQIDPRSDRLVDRVFHDAFNYFLLMTAARMPHAPGFCIFVRRRVHEALRGFDESIKLAEDHDYVMRAAKIGKFGVLRSFKIPVSVRRFDRDGRFNIARKYLLAELYLRTKGRVNEKDIHYDFNHYDEERITAAKEMKRQFESVAKLAQAKARKLNEILKREMKRPKGVKPRKRAVLKK
jgi:glycosyltransferase involved in cell wall biosynthesis